MGGLNYSILDEFSGMTHLCRQGHCAEDADAGYAPECLQTLTLNISTKGSSDNDSECGVFLSATEGGLGPDHSSWVQYPPLWSLGHYFSHPKMDA